MKHFTIVQQPALITFDSPHAVTLPLLDWLTLRVNLGYACGMLKTIGQTETAAVIEATLVRLHEQTDQAIDEAADADEVSEPDLIPGLACGPPIKSEN